MKQFSVNVGFYVNASVFRTCINKRKSVCLVCVCLSCSELAPCPSGSCFFLKNLNHSPQTKQ